MQATEAEINYATNSHHCLARRENTQVLSHKLMLEWYRVLWRIRRLSKPSALKRQQHAPPPILRLPVELIIEIIKGATSFSDHWETWSLHYYRELHSLAQVCRSFAGIIKGVSGLWSILDVSAARTGFHWNMVIQRSQSCPLIVRHTRLLSAHSTFWITMLHNIRRWKTASIALYSDGLRDVSSLEQSDAPTLEVLHLYYVKRKEESAVTLDLFQGGAPKLRELYLSAIALRDWGSPILRGLHLLSISDIDARGQYSMQKLMNALRECPELKVLQLYSIWFSNSSTARDRTIVVDLPRLDTLHLGLLHPDVEAADNLIKNIRTHRVKDLILEDDTSRDIALLPSFPTDRPFLTSAFDACIASGQSVKITAGTAHVQITMETELGEEGRFHLHYKFRAQDILEWVIPRLNDSALQIGLTFSPFRDMRLNAPCLSRLRWVVSVSIDDAGQELDTNEMLEALGSPRVLEDQAVGWLWPKLKTLTVQMGQGRQAEDVLYMLQERYGRVALGDPMKLIEPPAPLEELNLSMSICSDGSDMANQTLQKIREFLGGLGSCVFRCYGVVFEGDYTGSSDRGSQRAGDEMTRTGGKLWKRIQRKRGLGDGSRSP
ncbi:hypothetical protein FRB94_009462 [Tulasnella sp. JGI-2019a]|nr:hypothetical protein FRB94_009462 [Tulasnella sp. JGI-2019a]